MWPTFYNQRLQTTVHMLRLSWLSRVAHIWLVAKDNAFPSMINSLYILHDLSQNYDRQIGNKKTTSPENNELQLASNQLQGVRVSIKS